MMFTEALAAKIVKGEKTQTRRRFSTNPRSPWHPESKSYRPGATFTVNPGRGVERVAECEVIARRVQLLGALDEEIARAEGFGSMVDFRVTWKKINGAYVGEEEVTVVEFKLVGPDCMDCEGTGITFFAAGGAELEEDCTACFGTGVEPSSRAVDLIERLG